VSPLRSQPRLRNHDGLTLVEMLAALAVLAVGIVGVLVVVPVAIQGIHEGDQLSTATFLAEQALERARGAFWSEGPPTDCLGLSAGDAPPVPTSATCHGATSTQFPDELAGVAGQAGYRRSVRVTSCASELCGEGRTLALRRVEVRVAYTPLTARGVSAREKTLRLESLVTWK
jgi:prepilin-type N-terminal cleavage/methylation domain-containing protein